MAYEAALRADCPACGTVEVPTDAANLVLGFEHEGPQHVLRYTCPKCGRDRSDQLGERATRLLMAAGIGVVVGSATTSPTSQDGRATR